MVAGPREHWTFSFLVSNWYTMVHIAKVKVRPRKGGSRQTRSERLKLSNFTVNTPVPCRRELVAMLGCWAATGDILSTDPTRCQMVAETLFQCMRTAVSVSESSLRRSLTFVSLWRVNLTNRLSTTTSVN